MAKCLEPELQIRSEGKLFYTEISTRWSSATSAFSSQLEIWVSPVSGFRCCCLIPSGLRTGIPAAWRHQFQSRGELPESQCRRAAPCRSAHFIPAPRDFSLLSASPGSGMCSENIPHILTSMWDSVWRQPANKWTSKKVKRREWLTGIEEACLQIVPYIDKVHKYVFCYCCCV